MPGVIDKLLPVPAGSLLPHSTDEPRMSSKACELTPANVAAVGAQHKVKPGPLHSQLLAGAYQGVEQWA